MARSRTSTTFIGVRPIVPESLGLTVAATGTPLAVSCRLTAAPQAAQASGPVAVRATGTAGRVTISGARRRLPARAPARPPATGIRPCRKGARACPGVATPIRGAIAGITRATGRRTDGPTGDGTATTRGPNGSAGIGRPRPPTVAGRPTISGRLRTTSPRAATGGAAAPCRTVTSLGRVTW